MLQPGTVFALRYRVERPIADGGMGAVYEVTHLATYRRCALKVMLPNIASDPKLRERFLHEARIAAKVQSDYVVDVLDAGLDEDSGALFLVMELLRGEDLAQRLRRHQALPAAEVLTYLRQLGSALNKTHAQGIVHRDLKPQNLFLTHQEDGTPRIKILDFGISKVLEETTASDKRTEVFGSPLYMAPEQFSGQLPTPATDIFAVGMLTYSLLVGAPYWREEAAQFDNLLAFGMHVAGGPRDSAMGRALAAGVQLPHGFDEWFFKVTARLPEHRYASVSQAVEALEAVLTVKPKTLSERPAPTKTEPVDTIGPTASDDFEKIKRSESGVKRTRGWLGFSAFRSSAAAAAVLAAVGLWRGTMQSPASEQSEPQSLPTADIATGSALTWPLHAGTDTATPETRDNSEGTSTKTGGDASSTAGDAPASSRPLAGANTTTAPPGAGTRSPKPKAGAGNSPNPNPRPSATSPTPPPPPHPTLTCYNYFIGDETKLYTPGTDTRGKPTYPCVRGGDGKLRKKAP